MARASAQVTTLLTKADEKPPVKPSAEAIAERQAAVDEREADVGRLREVRPPGACMGPIGKCTLVVAGPHVHATCIAAAQGRAASSFLALAFLCVAPCAWLDWQLRAPHAAGRAPCRRRPPSPRPRAWRRS